MVTENMQSNIGSYEHRIIIIMIDENCTFSEAMLIDFKMHNIDISSVFDLVDYLEEQLGCLDKVQHMMDIYNGKLPDMKLKAIKSNES